MTKQTQTIEATGKRWKLLAVVGMLIFLPGLAMFGVGMLAEEASTAFAGGGVMLIGAVMRIWARLGAWWCHA